MAIKLDEKEEISDGNFRKLNVQLDAKLKAEDILNEAYRQTDSIYREVQEQLIEFKQNIKEYKQIIDIETKNINQHWEKKTALLEVSYAIKKKTLKKIYEREQNQMDILLEKKSIEFEINLDIKKEEQQKELIKYLDYLKTENDWFVSYQEQAQYNLESKEKELFLTIQKKQERFLLNEQEFTNQLNYYNDLINTKEAKVLKIGSVILLLATLSVVQLTFSSPPLISATVLPLLIACATVYIFSFNLSDGKIEKKSNKLFFQNKLLIEQNIKLKEETGYLEKDLKTLMDKRTISEKSDRSFADNFQFLTIMQQDLKESEMKRKVLESENLALRKYLLVKKTTED